jgi:hypothetical protein
VRQSYDSLTDIFECIENFTRRLKTYMDIQPTPAMTESIIKIMAEMLSVVSLAAEEMCQGKLSEPLFSVAIHDDVRTRILQKNMPKNSSERIKSNRSSSG